MGSLSSLQKFVKLIISFFNYFWCQNWDQWHKMCEKNLQIYFFYFWFKAISKFYTSVIHFTIHQFSILCLQLTHITDEFGRNLIWWICRIRQCLEIGRIVKLGKASMPFWFAIFLYFLLALSQKRLGYVDIRKRKASGLHSIWKKKKEN